MADPHLLPILVATDSKPLIGVYLELESDNFEVSTPAPVLKAFVFSRLLPDTAAPATDVVRGIRAPFPEPPQDAAFLAGVPLKIIDGSVSVRDHLGTPQALPVLSLSESTLNIGSRTWELRVTDLFPSLAETGFGLQIKLEFVKFSIRSDSSTEGSIRLHFAVNHLDLLPQPVRWIFTLVGDTDEQPNQVEFDSANPDKFTFRQDYTGAAQVFGITAEAGMQGSLEVALKPLAQGWQPTVALTATISGKIAVNLGSPLARLELTPAESQSFGLTLLLDAEQKAASASLSLPQALTAILTLDLFDVAGHAVINNIWKQVGGDSSGGGRLLQLEMTTIELAEGRNLEWRGEYLQLSQDLFDQLLRLGDDGSNRVLKVNEKRRLQALAGDVLGAATPTNVSFSACDSNGWLTWIAEDEIKSFVGAEPTPHASYLKLCLKTKVESEVESKTILTAGGTFVFEVPRSKDGLLQFEPRAFRCLPVVEVSVDNKQQSQFGLIALTVPAGTTFRFSLNPQAPRLEYLPGKSQEKSNAPISLTIPAGENSAGAEVRSFTFDLERFAFHSAGFDLRGAVRAENVDLNSGGTAPENNPFKTAIAVKGVEQTPDMGDPANAREHKIGEIEFRNSRLVYGSLQATAQLPYFDNATGTLVLMLSEVEDDGKRTLKCAGNLSISGIQEFHVDALYATFQIDVLNFGINYISGSHSWEANAAMSGRIRFAPPPGHSAGEMKELAELFQGLSVEFEDLDPIRIGLVSWTFNFSPKRFSFADVMRIDLRGIEVRGGQNGEPSKRGATSLKLLGDITLQDIPGLDASLTFGGIELQPAFPPKFRVDAIAVQISAPGFTMEGKWQFFETKIESGFAGAFSLQSDTFPRLAGMTKLTRIRALDGSIVPSIALFVETDVEVALVAGFFLRRLGIGLGIRQALRGLENRKTPLTRQIAAFVDNPAGLPEPRHAESWVPVEPKSGSDPISWMLVGSGLITFGNQPPDKPHPFAGGILLAIDQDLRIVAGVNVWLFTSPNETLRPEFIQRPAGRGAIAISVRQGRVVAMFRTLRSPRLGESAPPLLAQVLKTVQTSMAFTADRKGFLMEVGWPWETRVEYTLDSWLRGELTTGFRFGIYRGVTVFGLNYGIELHLQAGGSESFRALGFKVEASLTAEGHAYFRASFAGALDSAFRPYLLGDVRLGALVRVRAELSLSKKIFGRKIRKSWSATLFEISITAAITAALNSSMQLGFRGSAHVSVSVCGIRVGGSVHFSHQESYIDVVRTKLEHLLPPKIAEIEGSGGIPITTSRIWNYRFRRNKDRVRVLLFPGPGMVYPPHNGEAAQQRFKLRLTPKGKELFRGFLGTSEADAWEDDSVLIWQEDLDGVIPADNPDGLPPEVTEEQADLQLRDLLQPSLLSGQLPIFQGLAEQVDPRTYSPAPSDADDATAVIAPEGYYSPNLAPVTAYDQAVAAATDDRTVLEQLKASPLAFSVEITEALDTELKADPDGVRLADLIADTLGTANPPPDNVENLQELVKAVPKVTRVASSNGPTWLMAANEANDEPLSSFLVVREPAAPSNSAPDHLRFYELNDDTEALTGFFLADLLNLMGDERSHGESDQTVLAQLRQDYHVAPHLRLILEFDATKLTEPDPVGQLINLGVEHVLGGENRVLKSVLGDQAVRPEYDLVAGPTFQSQDRICLTWEFLREDAVEDATRPASERRDPFTAYVELEKFIVIRRNLSNPREQPQITTLYPAWLGKTNSGVLIRPQFQFVDPLVHDLDEGALLQYRVEAVAPDRTLAVTLINVFRQIVKPLSPLTQALALQSLSLADGSIEAGLVEILVAYQPKEENIEEENITEQLRLHWRKVAAATEGFYGFDLQPSVVSRWEQAAPSRAKDSGFPDIRFTTAGRDQPLPWTETQPVKLPDTSQWKEVWRPAHDDDPKELLGFQLLFDWSEWTEGKSLAPGEAIEFYVGREDDSAGRTIRSPLVKCRHAVTPAAQADPAPTTLDFTRGNTVDAFEPLPKYKAVRESLKPNQIDAQVDYGQPGQTEEPVGINLSWRHDLSGRHVFDSPQLDLSQRVEGFNPVVAYRLYRVDRYDPNLHPHPLAVLGRTAEVMTRVIPERLYRATPYTIEVRALPSLDPKRVPGVQEEADVHGEPAPVDPSAPRPIGDWKPAAYGLATVQPPETSDAFPYDYLAGYTIQGQQPDLPYGRIRHEAGPVWLHSDIVELIHKILEQLGSSVRCELQFHYPLEDKLLETSSHRPEEIAEKFQRLYQSLSPLFDPYGWWTAEALGLSCECRFVDGDGVPINCEVIRSLVEELEEVKVTACFFYADDRHTLLDVVRLIVTPEHLLGAMTDPKLGETALALQLIGRKRDNESAGIDSLRQLFAESNLSAVLEAGAYEVFRQLISSVVSVESGFWMADWAEEVSNRAKSALPVSSALPVRTAVYMHDVQMAGADSGRAVPQADIVLPIRRDGLVRYRLPIPDRMAHDYAVAVEPVRRYERLHRMLQTPESSEESSGNAVELSFRRVAVDRTQKLERHNLIGSPLPGSVQAIVFRHPAAFAATASAINAAYGQYSGQTLTLQRRVPEQDRLYKLYADFQARVARPLVYWIGTENDKHTLWVSDMKRKDHTHTPLADLSGKPKSLAFDYYRRILYWIDEKANQIIRLELAALEQGPQVVRAFESDVNAGHLVIDSERNTLYWSQHTTADNGAIESFNVETNERRPSIGNFLGKIVALAFSGNKLLWVENVETGGVVVGAIYNRDVNSFSLFSDELLTNAGIGKPTSFDAISVTPGGLSGSRSYAAWTHEGSVGNESGKIMIKRLRYSHPVFSEPQLGPITDYPIETDASKLTALALLTEESIVLLGASSNGETGTLVWQKLDTAEQFNLPQPALPTIAVDPGTVLWQFYEKWLEQMQFEAAKPTVKLLNEDGQQAVPLEPVAGSESSVFGADRYVFPDLPGYYEYQAVVYSTAGRAVSPPALTGWITPLYDTENAGDRRPARQRPRTYGYNKQNRLTEQEIKYGVRLALYDAANKQLLLRIALVHPRYHMLPELRPLWVNADERVVIPSPLNSGGWSAFPLGSLPDLYLTYQIYIRTMGGSVPVYEPFFQIAPPMPAPADGTGREWFEAIDQFPGLTGKIELAVVQGKEPDESYGEIQFGVEVALIEPQCASLAALLAAHDSTASLADVRSLIGVAVARHGVWSKIQPDPA